jgi:hypothetical protein
MIFQFLFVLLLSFNPGLSAEIKSQHNIMVEIGKAVELVSF